MRSDPRWDVDDTAVDVVHGRAVPDPFRWLEEADSPAVRRWLRERDEEFARAREEWSGRGWLAREIGRLAQQSDFSAPRGRGGSVFAAHRPAGGEHPRIVVAPDARMASPRVVFDPMVDDPTGRTTVDSWDVSPDGRHVAVQTSRDGTETGVLRVLTVSGREVDRIPGVRYSDVAWLPPGLDTPRRGGPPAFYYVRRDESGGGRGVWLRRAAGDVLVRGCVGAATVPGVRVEGGRWLVASEGHGTGHREDLWLADLAATPADGPVFVPVHTGRAIETEPRIGPDGMLYLRTNADAPRRRLCRASPDRPHAWTEVIAENDAATLDAFAVVGSARSPEILASWTRLGISTLTVHDPTTGRRLGDVTLPGAGMVTRIDTDRSADGSVVAYVSYADVARDQRMLTFRSGDRDLGGPSAVWPPARPEDQAPRPGEEPDDVRRRVMWCRSADGTPVPVTVLRSRGTTGRGPTLLHAYGSYGRSRQFGYSATVLAWLRMGGTYAVAHVRGGGDLGRAWHRAGQRRGKTRSVDDLVAAAEDLVRRGWCVPRHLCLSGGSAGGMLVLAAAMRRPDVCGSVIALAPLTDMARYEFLGLGRMWTAEFGSVADPLDASALLDYSPYHRALAGGLDPPAVLLNGFHGDTRTGAAHARKMCAALRRLAPDRVLLRYEYGVGHGPRAVSRAVELAADAHAFAAARTGLSPPGTVMAPEQ